MPGNSVRHAQSEVEQVRAYSVAPKIKATAFKPERSTGVRRQSNCNQSDRRRAVM